MQPKLSAKFTQPRDKQIIINFVNKYSAMGREEDLRFLFKKILKDLVALDTTPRTELVAYWPRRGLKCLLRAEVLAAESCEMRHVDKTKVWLAIDRHIESTRRIAC